MNPIAEYREPIQFCDEQLKIFWLPDEIKVEKDIQDMLVNMTPAERHGVITTLKLFTLYEMKAGDEYWGGRFKRIFPQVEFVRMASAFSMFEMCVHMPFYSKINELLYVHTPEFYNSYVDNPILRERMDFIDNAISDPNDLVSLAVFSLIEGVVLYSSFAFLKHFQSEGKNKLMNIVRGINFSVRDENIHAQAGAWCFRLATHKDGRDSSHVAETIYTAAQKIYEHEEEIIDMIFSQGPIDGITPAQMRNFVQSRINQCLHNLGYKHLFKVGHNPIADSFYKGINNFTYNDFFSGQGREYSRNWSEAGFTW